MYPFIRLLSSSIRASTSKTLDMGDVCETNLLCMPWDMDMFLEMNNGRVLTLFDIGRFDLAIRTGLAKVLKHNKWGLVVAGSSIRYRGRVKTFDRVTMRTRLAGMDEKWVYVAQSMWVKGLPTSSVLLRTGITSKGKVIPTDELLTAMNITDWKPEPSAWVKSWISIEKNRPWPPDS